MSAFFKNFLHRNDDDRMSCTARTPYVGSLSIATPHRDAHSSSASEWLWDDNVHVHELSLVRPQQDTRRGTFVAHLPEPIALPFCSTARGGFVVSGEQAAAANDILFFFSCLHLSDLMVDTLPFHLVLHSTAFALAGGRDAQSPPAMTRKWRSRAAQGKSPRFRAKATIRPLPCAVVIQQFLYDAVVH